MLQIIRDYKRKYAKQVVLKLLDGINRGVLVVDSAGIGFEFGNKFLFTVDGHSESLQAKIIVKDERFWLRLLLNADIGFAEAFMLDEIVVDNLSNVFKIFILNSEALSGISGCLSSVIHTVSYISNLRLSNGMTGSKRNISAHYDLSNEVFASFLSWDMTYTCAIFDEQAKGPIGDLIDQRPISPPRLCYSSARLCPADDLERGQLAKLLLIARRARITRQSRVLEIGCGWGSFAIFAAATYGATVEALTLSIEQAQFAVQNVQHAGLSHLINIQVLDYRQMPQIFHRAFDAVVSLGVMEHVGTEFMATWFKKMEWAMKSTNSVKVFAMTTVPDTRWRKYARGVDFIKKYIFPGGQLSSIKTLTGHITAAGLNVVSIEDIGPHYARTLREWRYRFDRNFDSHIRPALLEKYPDMTEDNIKVFQRKWQYYFMYCEAGFATRRLQDHIVVCSREANLTLISTVDA